MGRDRPAVQLPDPEHFWIRFSPRVWEAGPPAEVPWLDLARGRLGFLPAGDARVSGLPGGPLDDVLYVPPVAAEWRAERDRRAAAVAAEGTPVLVQLLPGELAPEEVVGVYDLLSSLLAGNLVALAALPPGSHVVWPLVAGLTDDSELQEEGCRRLAEAGVATVQAVAPDLPPADRRRLYELAAGATAGGAGEGADAVFDALFHGRPPIPRDFARRAHTHGLAPFLPRPVPRPPLSGAAGREIAGLLALAGELSARLGRVGRGQSLFRTARWIDRGELDLRALAREGNLHVLHWLDPEGRRIVEEWAETGTSETVQALLDEFVGPAD